MHNRVLEFSTETAAIDYLEQDLTHHLQFELNHQALASLILTGGTSIQPFLKRFAKITLPWERVVVTLSDERWVSAENERSNERQLKEYFLNQLPQKARYVGLKTTHEHREDELLFIQQRFEMIPTPYTYAVLGMGSDGHIASLFEPPHINEDFCVATEKEGEKRVSLGAKPLQAVKKGILLVKGKARHQVFNKLVYSHTLVPLDVVRNYTALLYP